MYTGGVIKGSAGYSISSSNNLMNLFSGQCKKNAYGIVLEVCYVYLKKSLGIRKQLTKVNIYLKYAIINHTKERWLSGRKRRS